MKHVLTTLFCLLITISLWSQSPIGFNYQGVARNFSGEIISNQNIALRISVLQGTADGSEVFQEVHNATTSNLGLFTLKIGSGDIQFGDLGGIKWGTDSYFLQIELDQEGGNDFRIIGTSELLSVPYSLYAENGFKHFDSRTKRGNNALFTGRDEYATFKHLEPSNSILFQAPDGVDNTGLQLKNISEYQAAYLDFHTGNNNARIIFNHNPYGSRNLSLLNNSFGQPNGITIDGFGRVGFNVNFPKESIHVNDGDIFLEGYKRGVIMQSPDGQCWKMTVDNSGQPVFSEVSCPE